MPCSHAAEDSAPAGSTHSDAHSSGMLSQVLNRGTIQCLVQTVQLQERAADDCASALHQTTHATLRQADGDGHVKRLLLHCPRRGAGFQLCMR